MLIAMGIVGFVLIGLGIHHLSSAAQSMFMRFEGDSGNYCLILGLIEAAIGMALIAHILS
jgi:hypothetical protein